MFTRRNLKLAVVFVSLLTTGYFLVAQITRAQRTGGSGPTNSQIPERDLRKNPPQVDEFQARLLERPSREGNALLLVRFAPEEEIPAVIDVQLDEKAVTFHDDGKNGDEKAADGLHSAITTIDLEEERKDQQRIANIQAEAVPIFRGRELVGLNRINRDAILQLRPGGLINLLPIGNPANIDIERSLMIRDPSVVQDPTRTRNGCNASSMGKWSFGYLMQQMAPPPSSGITPEAFVLRWLKRWSVNQTVNDLNVPARVNINSVIASWPKIGTALDLSRAPFRLLAIVNRADLRGSFSYGGGGAGNGGELRFVFAYVNPVNCKAAQFTVIFEFGVTKNTCGQMKNWALQWKNLDTKPIGTPAYNAALEAITEQIVTRNANPARTNGSALNQLRTNEIFLAGPWELREFQLLSVNGGPLNGGHLEEVTVKQTPANSFNNSAVLATYIGDFARPIISQRHTVPLDIGGNAFLGGSSPTPSGFFWRAPGIAIQPLPFPTPTVANARHMFSLQTCNSCHNRETNTGFTHVHPTGFGGPVGLSGFLTGITVPDPVSATPRTFNDLLRRATDLDALINTPCFKQFAIKPVTMTH